MDWSAIGGAALDFAGALFGNSATADMQQANIEWQREQLTHRHQWEVQDLKKAGLNPILSAMNGTGAVSAGSPQGVAPQLGKALEALSHSALMKKQEEIVDFQNETERIKANADMLRAKQEEARTESAIGLNQSQSTLALKSAEMLDKNYELNKLYNEANIREIDQRIINSVMEVQAKVEYYHQSGQAALMSASAAQTQASAALSNAESQRIIAEVAAANGISQRDLNDALAGKASAETLEAYERAFQINKKTGILDWQLQKDKVHNPYGANDGLGRAFMGVGEILRNGFAGTAGFLP